ncbi:MAG: hypothetical protein K6V97_03925 [Actinomycetia bacterium]|nr:hypothetical protein [Actinomycetes bacterium]
MYLVFGGAQSGDTVTVNLVRLSGYTDGQPQTLATQTVAPTTNQSSATVTFALETIREYQPFDPITAGPGSNLIAPASRDNGIYRGVAGIWQIQVTVTNANGSPGPTAQSEPFRITIIPTDELRHLWLRGVPLEALDVVAPLFQPQQVTGVRIRDVGQSTLAGVYPLTFTPGSPPTLAWANGPPQTITGTARQTLVCQSQDGQSYVVLEVVPWLLPSASVTETILVSGSQFTDDNLQRYVDYATGQLESAWYFFVEPHTSDTDPLISEEQGAYTLQARGVVSSSYHVEHQEVPMTYRRPRDFAHWMSFSLPRKQIQVVYYLYGYFNQSQAVSIGRDWIVFDPVTGVLELVPDNGAIISWQFYGAAILQFFINYDTIPLTQWRRGAATHRGTPGYIGEPPNAVRQWTTPTEVGHVA